jgi:biopolymer transport protein TolR
MGAALDTGKGKKGVRPNINVTPLVDVVLVLLIIFMVIIPNMQDGKPIEIINVFNPDKDDRGEGRAADRHHRPRARCSPSTTRTGARAGAIADLQGIYARNPKRKLLIRGDAKLPYVEGARLLPRRAEHRLRRRRPRRRHPALSGTAARR